MKTSEILHLMIFLLLMEVLVRMVSDFFSSGALVNTDVTNFGLELLVTVSGEIRYLLSLVCG